MSSRTRSAADVPGFVISGELPPDQAASTSTVDLGVRRNGPTLLYVTWIMALWWALSVSAVLLVWAVAIWRSAPPPWAYGYLVGVLFALAPLRGALPGQPPYGVLVDYVSFYWAVGSMGLGLLLLASVLVIYLILGILYESFIHPLTILSGLPSAGFGALVTLMLFRMELNIYAFVGMIMLIGIVEKNAIMQIDFALEAERKGMTSTEAIYQGCLIRFRPIMMTTMAAMLGAVPIALGQGAGGEARQPLGLVVDAAAPVEEAEGPFELEGLRHLLAHDRVHVGADHGEAGVEPRGERHAEVDPTPGEDGAPLGGEEEVVERAPVEEIGFGHGRWRF